MSVAARVESKWSRGELNPRAKKLHGCIYACSRLFSLNRGTVVDNLPFGPAHRVVSSLRPQTARNDQPEIVDPAPTGHQDGIVTA